eukprot:COSAG01_NODE_10398_length_2176_cov_5.910448_1_plen_275_part_00
MLRDAGFFGADWVEEAGVFRNLVALGVFADVDDEAAGKMFSAEVERRGTCWRTEYGLERQHQKHGGVDRVYLRVVGQTNTARGVNFAVEDELKKELTLRRLKAAIKYELEGPGALTSAENELRGKFFSVDAPKLRAHKWFDGVSLSGKARSGTVTVMTVAMDLLQRGLIALPNVDVALPLVPHLEFKLAHHKPLVSSVKRPLSLDKASGSATGLSKAAGKKPRISMRKSDVTKGGQARQGRGNPLDVRAMIYFGVAFEKGTPVEQSMENFTAAA